MRKDFVSRHKRWFFVRQKYENTIKTKTGLKPNNLPDMVAARGSNSPRSFFLYGGKTSPDIRERQFRPSMTQPLPLPSW